MIDFTIFKGLPLKLEYSVTFILSKYHLMIGCFTSSLTIRALRKAKTKDVNLMRFM